MRASIIIPSYNYGQFLAETIESALAQTTPAHEVIVVDDGSNDDSIGVAQRYPVTLIARRHEGAPATMGAGVAASTGDCFVMLGADDKLAPNYLEATLPLLAADATIGFVYTDVTLFGVVERRLPARPFSLARLLAANYIHASALTRRAAYGATPGYAAVNLSLYEDWYLFLSMVQAGWRARWTSETTLFYRQHGASRNQIAGWAHERAIERIIRDHAALYRPWPGAWHRLHRTLFLRAPRLYVALLMAACAVPRRRTSGTGASVAG